MKKIVFILLMGMLHPLVFGRDYSFVRLPFINTGENFRTMVQKSLALSDNYIYEIDSETEVIKSKVLWDYLTSASDYPLNDQFVSSFLQDDIYYRTTQWVLERLFTIEGKHAFVIVTQDQVESMFRGLFHILFIGQQISKRDDTNKFCDTNGYEEPYKHLKGATNYLESDTSCLDDMSMLFFARIAEMSVHMMDKKNPIPIIIYQNKRIDDEKALLSKEIRTVIRMIY